MTYQETLNWMFSQLPMYQRQGQTAFKKAFIEDICDNIFILENQLNQLLLGILI